MRENEIEIQDLYEGAYLLCRGFELKNLTVIGSNGKPIVTFIIIGDNVVASPRAYRSGQATANVALLKFTMEKLKDQMFAKIRSASAQKSYGAPGERERKFNRRSPNYL